MSAIFLTRVIRNSNSSSNSHSHSHSNSNSNNSNSKRNSNSNSICAGTGKNHSENHSNTDNGCSGERMLGLSRRRLYSCSRPNFPSSTSKLIEQKAPILG